MALCNSNIRTPDSNLRFSCANLAGTPVDLSFRLLIYRPAVFREGMWMRFETPADIARPRATLLFGKEFQNLCTGKLAQGPAQEQKSPHAFLLSIYVYAMLNCVYMPARAIWSKVKHKESFKRRHRCQNLQQHPRSVRFRDLHAACIVRHHPSRILEALQLEPLNSSSPDCRSFKA